MTTLRRWYCRLMHGPEDVMLPRRTKTGLRYECRRCQIVWLVEATEPEREPVIGEELEAK